MRCKENIIFFSFKPASTANKYRKKSELYSKFYRKPSIPNSGTVKGKVVPVLN
jgi:hypothetical protein